MRYALCCSSVCVNRRKSAVKYLFRTWLPLRLCGSPRGIPPRQKIYRFRRGILTRPRSSFSTEVIFHGARYLFFLLSPVVSGPAFAAYCHLPTVFPSGLRANSYLHSIFRALCALRHAICFCHSTLFRGLSPVFPLLFAPRFALSAMRFAASLSTQSSLLSTDSASLPLRPACY